MSTGTTFVSYSSTDSTFVVKLASDLRNSGANLWVDKFDIIPGEPWDLSIEAALNSAQRIIVVLSPASVASKNVMDEISFALEKGMTIIPILFEHCTIPFRIKRLHHIDLTSDYQAGVRQLIGILSPVTEKDLTSHILPKTRPEKRHDFKTYLMIGGGVLLLVFGIGWLINRFTGIPQALENLNKQPAFALIQIGAAQKEASNGATVSVALLGTGITSIPQLRQHVKPGKSFIENDMSTQDLHGQGTRMASIIAAVAPPAQLIPLKTSTISGILNAIDYSIKNKIRILVLSAALLSDNLVLQKAMSLARNEGVLIIAPAGNDGKMIPAKQDVMFVGSTTNDDRISAFSNVGAAVKFFAPGSEIHVLDNQGNLQVMSGTIIASSVVAGVAALALSVRPELSPGELESIIYNSSMIIQKENKSYRRINAVAAVRLARGYLRTNNN